MLPCPPGSERVLIIIPLDGLSPRLTFGTQLPPRQRGPDGARSETDERRACTAAAWREHVLNRCLDTCPKSLDSLSDAEAVSNLSRLLQTCRKVEE